MSSALASRLFTYWATWEAEEALWGFLNKGTNLIQEGLHPDDPAMVLPPNPIT